MKCASVVEGISLHTKDREGEWDSRGLAQRGEPQASPLRSSHRSTSGPASTLLALEEMEKVVVEVLKRMTRRDTLSQPVRHPTHLPSHICELPPSSTPLLTRMQSWPDRHVDSHLAYLPTRLSPFSAHTV